jgi:hypothetical protein
MRPGRGGRDAGESQQLKPAHGDGLVLFRISFRISQGSHQSTYIHSQPSIGS